MTDLAAKFREARQLPPSLLAREVLWRVCRQGVGLVVKRREKATGPRVATLLTPRPFLLAPNIAAVVARVDAKDRRRAIDEAKAALRGSFDVLGFGRLDFGDPPSWQTDPLRSFAWPGDGARAMPGRADIKVPWEASRMHWLSALGRAAVYTDDPSFPNGALRLLTHWAEHNPVGRGVNWANAMEAGIRAVNLAWAAELFTEVDIRELCGGLLRQHGQFITEHLEYSPRLTSNHYLADVVGLLYCGGALRHTSRGRVWLSFARRSFCHEVHKQFRSDGGNFEASTLYHRLSTELVLLGLVVMQRLDLSIPDSVLERFAGALDALRVMTKPDGRLVAVGDDDSGLAVGLMSGRDPRDPAPVLRAGAALLNALPDDHSTPADELSLWTLGRSSVLPTPAGPTALSASGWYLMRDEVLWCLAECGGVGQNGNGGHAHNDTLSFTLCVHGKEFIADPGTGEYTGRPDLRNQLRATTAHAAVAVDGAEINRLDPAALFVLSDDDSPAVERVLFADDEQVVVAHHDGYRRLEDPVRHSRTWRLGDGRLTVADELRAAERHTATVTFPLAPGVIPRVTDGGWSLVHGGASVHVRVEPVGMKLELVDALYSPRYGATEPTVALRAEVAMPAGGASWAVVFTPGDKETR